MEHCTIERRSLKTKEDNFGKKVSLNFSKFNHQNILEALYEKIMMLTKICGDLYSTF